MNYKLLFPTYRGRQRWVLQTLDRIKRAADIARLINVGCGEGDIDCDLREYSGHLVSLDINPQDVMHARMLNADTADVRYIVADADYLPFDGATFDVACCLEVIEHVADPRACLRELARVVRFGGYVLVTCPSARFPLTYDPVNWVLLRIGAHMVLLLRPEGTSVPVISEGIYRLDRGRSADPVVRRERHNYAAHKHPKVHLARPAPAL